MKVMTTVYSNKNP